MAAQRLLAAPPRHALAPSPRAPAGSAAARGTDVLVELEQVGRVVAVLDLDQAGVGVGRVGGPHLVLARLGGEVDVAAAGAPRAHRGVGLTGPAGVLVEALAVG